LATQSFLSEDFLLHSKYAKTLFHNYAKSLPIIDYHCHLSPEDIANNRTFENLTSIWLEGDHYKWRAMRALGISEDYITGNRTAKEKFGKWAATVPYTMRNPLYHWTHLELQRYFGISELLDEKSGADIYTKASAQLQTDALNTRSILKKMNVEVVCTTDDPVDTLEHHKKIRKENVSTLIRPTFRPDKAFSIENENYGAYIENLSGVSGIDINSYEKLLEALMNRIDYFHAHGCQLSDHGLEQLYSPADGTHFELNTIFKSALANEKISLEKIQYFKYCVLLELGRAYHQKGWVQQFHLGAIRNTNTRMLTLLGPDTGFDSIGDYSQCVALAKFLNALDSTDQLTKTILYNLNPADNEVMGTMIGNFNDGSVKGKIQFGSAWWFLDQKDGMEKQLNALSNLGLLSCFIGMLTDSRSFMSFPRHEYFRRILCNLIGQDVEKGELPWDEQWLGKIISDICYYNGKNYFNFQK
jgi:glucuronate isomerase